MKLRHLLWLWLAVAMFVLPQSMQAEDYFQAKYTSMCFMVTPKGQGAVHIKVMHLDQTTGTNGYLQKTGDCPDGAWIYAEAPGQKRRYIVSLYNNNDRSDDNDKWIDITTRFSGNAEGNYPNGNGVLILTNTDNGTPRQLQSKTETIRIKKPTGDARCYAEFDWYYPTDWAGKEVKFFINGPVGHGEALSNREITPSSIIFSAVPELTLSEPIFTPVGEYAGFYSMVVANTTGSELKVTKVTELNTTQGTANIDITDQCKKSKDGYSLYIPSTNYTHQVKVEAQVPYNQYIYYNLPPKTVTIKAVHNPKDFNLKAEWGKKAASVLKWTVPNADEEDALYTDAFIIQRQLYNLNKNTEEDTSSWETIGQMLMEQGKANYEYTDSTQGCYGDTIHNSVRYRIYRAAIGATEGNVGQYDWRNKRDYVPGYDIGVRYASFQSTSQKDPNPVIIWYYSSTLVNHSADDHSYIPDDAHTIIRRTSEFMKNGVPVTYEEDFDVTTLVRKGGADVKSITGTIYPNSFQWVDDNGFAPCTKYSYQILYLPNDPSEIMPNRTVDVSIRTKVAGRNTDVTKIEPVQDDTKIGDFKASYDTEQNRIHLSWNVDMKRIDKLTILKLNQNKWEELPVNLSLPYYDDYAVEAGMDVEYRLSIQYECTDGEKKLSVDVTGKRRATGKIAGFLTFKDGTGLADVEVKLFREQNGQREEVTSVKTSSTGAYIFPDVPYSDMPYIVVPKTTLYPSLDPKEYPVYLNKNQTEFFNKNFISDDAFDIDGYVYYENTTVPVYGASFKIDGETVVDKSGNVIISDNDGHFQFKARKGTKRLTVEKEGHTFMFDGLYADNKGAARPINSNQTNVLFWDQTKVLTIGRVVGGLDQGEKTLGFGLSKNNLGDDLRIVLEQEGNQRSWLVKDQLNDALTVVHDTLAFETADGKKTSTVLTERHRVIITPNVETGEYQAKLLPIRYKVVEISAKGHPTLFQKGKVSEVLDLTDSLTTKTITYDNKQLKYNAIYNRIFRVEPDVNITELNDKGEPLPHYGLAEYTEPAANGGGAITVPLYDSNTKTYTFDYPVFLTGMHYFRITATENYYYNGEVTDECESVPVRGGKVHLYDDFSAMQRDSICTLDERTGSVDISVNVEKTVYDVQGTNALRHMDVDLEHEGQFIDSRNLLAFVMGEQQVTDDVISAGEVIMLNGILRDPPGSKSYAWIDTGSTFTNEFHCTFDIDLSLQLTYQKGTGANIMQGTYSGMGGGTYIGTQSSTKTTITVSPNAIPLIGAHFAYTGHTTFTMNKRMETSADPSMVGAKADIFYGNELVAATSYVRHVRAINEATYLYLKELGMLSETDGPCTLIAQGENSIGQPCYLISDYAVRVGPKVKTEFAYTQDYILNTLLPKLRLARNSYLYKGTRAEAKARANATLNNVFLSLRGEDDPRYGQDNLDDSLQYISIDRYDELNDRLNYEVITPDYIDVLGLRKQMAKEAALTDSVRIMNSLISQWEYIIAYNEYDKIQAFQTVDRTNRSSMDYNPGTAYNVDENASFYLENHTISGGIGITHNQSFDSKVDRDYHIPLVGVDLSEVTEGKSWMNGFNQLVNTGLSAATSAFNSNKNFQKSHEGNNSVKNVVIKYKVKNTATGQPIARTKDIDESDVSNVSKMEQTMKDIKSSGAFDIEIATGGTHSELKIVPSVSANYSSDNNSDLSESVTQGYHLETNPESNLSIDVYHDVEQVVTSTGVFGNSGDKQKFSKGNFVFRSLGGSTKCPYEPADVSKYYRPGTILSAATAQVEKPCITVENHIISNVPYGERAKFNLVLSNEGTLREEGSFDLVLLDKSNQTGASLIMDGAPLGNGRSVVVPYGTGMVKVLEIGQGMVDDYENIRIALRSQCDPTVADTVSLSVHFVPSASPIAVITPQDKWVLNTNSAQDERGRYYMPMTVGGYDVNFRNFDHVELQYKQSSEPESRWTNLCSYYNNDSLYQKGTGTKAMIMGGTLTHAFYGDSDPVELKYDLRAVTYSRLGNDFVTTSSPVFSGIKDTRRPQVFGSPQPANGILGVGNDLKLVFSENINANKLLSSNNFKVTGMPNNSVIGTTTYLQLQGDYSSYLETEEEYCAPDESFTIDMMLRAESSLNHACSLFEHYYNNDRLGFKIDIDFINNEPFLVVQSLMNVIKQQVISAKLDGIGPKYQRIAVVYDKPSEQILIYQNNNLLVKKKVLVPIKRTGKMRFGRGFAGSLKETRIWSKALTASEIEETANKTMYGNEVGLVAYYPMDEGYGESLEDKSLDNNLTMNEVKWITPEGCSFRLTGKHFTHELKREMFERTSAEKSYTLSMWFKAKDKSNFPIMASGYGVKEEENANEKLFIGVRDKKLTIASDTTSIVMNKSYADNQWHQLTFVVDRPANMASAYIDGELTGQAQASGFGKLYGAAPFRLGQVNATESENQLVEYAPMEGFIDEITLWDMALPRNVVKQRMNVSHDGAETGLLAYIPFSENVPQITGSGTLLEFSTNYFANKWDTELQKTVSMTDNAFGNGSQLTNNMMSTTEYATVKERGAVRDLRFDFVTKDNEMIIELKELPKDIDRTTVNITAMGIEDLNGNEMAQPVTWSAFIDRNSVRWAESQKTIDIDAQKEEDYTFTVDINNHGGAQRDYTIEGVPDWMTIEEGTMDTLDPEETITLHITISKDINIGTYHNVLYLKNDEELVNPLALTIKKNAVTPDWTFNKNGQSNMQVIAQVKMNEAIVTNKESILAAFDEYDKCLGTTHVTIDKNDKALFYLTIYGEKRKTPVKFRLWDATSGITYGVNADRDITYWSDSIVATYDAPVVMTANTNITRPLELTPTWTWVSLNVASSDANDIGQFLKRGKWQDGDQFKDPESQTFYNYYKGVWNSSGATGPLRTDRMYYIKSQKAQNIYIEGDALIDEADRTITLHPKWNYIGYTPMVNLPVNEALEDLKLKASDGDIIKSQDEFATFAASVGGWRGNLQYMKPGKGYMLYHKVTAEHPEEEIKFVYPFKSTAAVIAMAGAKAREIAFDDENEPLWTNTRRTTMNLILRTEGITAEEGDRLYAYAEGELCGIAEATDVEGEQTFFLSVGGEEKKTLTFTLERDGRLLGAATRSGIMYQADSLEGTTDVPKVIDFSSTSAYEDGIWYTLTGIRVGERRPATPGAYIFNGQKVMIK